MCTTARNGGSARDVAGDVLMWNIGTSHGVKVEGR